MSARPQREVDAELGRRAVAAGRAAGLAAVEVTSAEPFDETRRHLEERRSAGLHGTMQFTYRNPMRATDPRATLPWARSIVAGAWPYGDEPAPPATSNRSRSSPERPAGRVARYAARDHYAALAGALDAVATVLRDAGARAVVVVDENHQVDRAVAHRAGLGWYGKNSLVLLPGAGSWFVLGSVVTDAELDHDDGAPVADGCGPCTRCLDACPTGAIIAPGVVDARRCLAWAVQAPGAIPRELRVPMGGRIYGCDDCQEVCPPNRVQLRKHRQAPPPTTDRSAGGRGAEGAGSERPEETGTWVDLLDLVATDDATLLDRYGRWYIADRDPRWLRRNAIVALGNVAARDDEQVADALRGVLMGTDDLLIAHAVWSARRLGRDDLIDEAFPLRGPLVTAELAAPPPPARGTDASDSTQP